MNKEQLRIIRMLLNMIIATTDEELTIARCNIILKILEEE